MAGFENSTSLPVSRRTILVGVAAVAVASHMKSGGATRRISPEMDELRRRWHALVHRFESMAGVDAENPLWDLLDRSFDDLSGAIATMPARMIGDVVFKLEVTLYGAGMQVDTERVEGILVDLRALDA